MMITTIFIGMDAYDGLKRAYSGGGIILAHHLFDVGHYSPSLVFGMSSSQARSIIYIFNLGTCPRVILL
jgi:hypothetical protein